MPINAQNDSRMIVFNECECCAMHTATISDRNLFTVQHIDSTTETRKQKHPKLFEKVPELALEKISCIFSANQEKLGMLFEPNKDTLIAFKRLAELECAHLLLFSKSPKVLPCGHTLKEHLKALNSFVKKVAIALDRYMREKYGMAPPNTNAAEEECFH